jgi:4-amino-4-deoxy-L-arabinose transferase-like glycosyltransferase
MELASRADARQARAKTLLVIGTLSLIVLVAAALRFADLGSNPGGLYPDEAAEALSARRILDDPGYRPVLLVDNGGREALWAYVVAGAFLVGGETALMLHVTAATIGVLGVLAVWLLGRRFGKGAGLAAAAWAASALWLVSLSRVGFRTTTVPLLAAGALLALVVWHERPTRRTAVLAGGATALAALYTYQPMRLLPVVILLWLLTVRATDIETFRRLRASLGSFAISFLLVGLPMIVTAAADPQLYLGRSIGVTPFNPGLDAEDPITHALRTLGMFAFTGDPNPRHNVNDLPLLAWPLALVALVGLAGLWRGRRQGRNALILWSLVVFLVPPIIATEGGSPHFLRSVGLAAPLAVVIGVGAADIVEWFSTRRFPRLPAPVPSYVGVALAGIGFGSLALGSAAAYFARPVSERYHAFSYELVAIADAARGPSQVAILDDFAAMSVRFLGGASAPRIVAPGTVVDTAGVERTVARTTGELREALGDELADRAIPIAWDPLGAPTVWAVDID